MQMQLWTTFAFVFGTSTTLICCKFVVYVVSIVRLTYLFSIPYRVDDNFIDITQKLVYMFQFHWQVVLEANPANAKQLTGLLLIDYNQLKKDVLMTIKTILNCPNLSTNIRDSIMEELVLLKDVLLAMCYYEPYKVAINAVSLIEAHSEILLNNSCLTNSFFALMANPKTKIQELAKKCFLNHVEIKSGDGQPSAKVFLETLESCVSAAAVREIYLPLLCKNSCNNPYTL